MPQEERAAWFFGGAAVALTLSSWLDTERLKSRSEREDSTGTRALALIIDDLLDDVLLEVDEESESGYHNALGSFLEEELEEEVEWEPSTPFGRPDLLIDDRVALELKFCPRKTEIDRCIGQIHGFTDEWLTILVLFGTPPSRAHRIREALDGAGLEHVPVVEFK